MNRKKKELTNENKSLKFELLNATKKFNDMAEMVNDLEQYLRRESFKIRDILVFGNRPYEGNTDNIFIRVAKLIGVKVKHEGILVSHRLYILSRKE